LVPARDARTAVRDWSLIASHGRGHIGQLALFLLTFDSAEPYGRHVRLLLADPAMLTLNFNGVVKF